MPHLTICHPLDDVPGDTRGVAHCHALLLGILVLDGVLDVVLGVVTLLPVGGVASLLGHVLCLVREDNVAFLLVEFLTNPEGRGLARVEMSLILCF